MRRSKISSVGHPTRCFKTNRCCLGGHIINPGRARWGARSRRSRRCSSSSPTRVAVADPERPFAARQASDDARYSDADAPLHHVPERAAGRATVGATRGRGVGAGRGAMARRELAMAKYARVHRAVLEAEAEADATTARRAKEAPGAASRVRRGVAGAPPRGVPVPAQAPRAAASALALALVTDRAFLVDDPIWRGSWTSTRRARSPSTCASRGAQRPRRRRPLLSLSTSKTTTTTTTTNERGNGETRAPDARDDPSDVTLAVTLPCGGVAGMRASASQVAVFSSSRRSRR